MEILLAKSDRETFQERLDRSRYLERIAPRNLAVAGSFEFVFLLQEAGLTFVNGAHIATILLGQAFIEQRLQDALMAKGIPEKDLQGLQAIVSQCRKRHLLNEILLKKIDHLRQARNPFTHLKPLDHPFTISRRIFSEQKPPKEILEKDAKEALALMYMVLTAKL